MTTVNNISPFSKILVGVDSSENSYRAFEYALHLSKMSRAKVYLLHVIEISSAPGSFVGISDLEKSFEEEAQKLLDGIVARVDEQNNVFRIENIQKVIRKGHPSKMILEIGKSVGADLIVVGSKGVVGVKEFLLGSVSHAVSRHAAVPVLIVK